MKVSEAERWVNHVAVRHCEAVFLISRGRVVPMNCSL